jgi:hypothetical protein
MSVNGRPPTTTEAANAAAVSKLGDPLGSVASCVGSVGSPVLKVFLHHVTWVAAKSGLASIASMSASYRVSAAAGVAADSMAWMSVSCGKTPVSLIDAVRSASP